jgi:hypothetical protein
MMNRRAFLSAATASGLVAGPQIAVGQAFKVPQTGDLLQSLKSPALIEKMLSGTSALRTLLLFELSQIERDERGDIWRRDEEKFFTILRPLRDPAAQAMVAKLLEAKDPRAYSDAITEKAIPAVKRIEGTLSKGGLQPGSPFSAELLTSFLNVNRFLVALSAENDSWYCRIYPLSIACG